MKTRMNAADIKKLKASLEEESKDEPMSEKELIERSNLLEKYGLKEMDEDDVEQLLGARNSNNLNNKDLENMERILAKKIYQSIKSIPGIKKAAIEVFMENYDELYGNINIIAEYESGGFLEKIIGNSSKDDVYFEIIEVTEIELWEIFENSPEIIENFELNIEFL